MELLRAAGFNAIRSAHNPMSKAMLSACDRLGMLVMDETFDMWMQTKSDDDYALRFADWWEADVEAMVRKDVNHPSVIFYSIGNEVPDGSTPVGLHLGRALAEKVRALDDTRFVTQAVTGLLVGGPELFDDIRDAATATGTDEETGVNTATMNLADFMGTAMRSPVVTDKTSEAFSYLDVCGYNYMATRFELDRELFPQRVIVATESHAPSVDTDWAGVLGNPNVIGDFTWTGWDYLGEAGIGRIEYGEQPNAARHVGVRRRLPVAHRPVRRHRHHRPPPSPVVLPRDRLRPPHRSLPRRAAARALRQGRRALEPVVVERRRLELELGRPRGRAGRRRGLRRCRRGGAPGERPLARPAARGAEHRFRAQFDTTYEPGLLEAVARRGDAEIGRTQLRSATGPVLLDVRADRSEIRADPSDLAFVELTLVDAAGSLYTAADRRVAVELDGPGVLQGLGSANPCTEEGFTDVACTTFDGRALAVVRPTGAGTIALVATADGCEPVRVCVETC